MINRIGQEYILICNSTTDRICWIYFIAVDLSCMPPKLSFFANLCPRTWHILFMTFQFVCVVLDSFWSKDSTSNTQASSTTCVHFVLRDCFWQAKQEYSINRLLHSNSTHFNEKDSVWCTIQTEWRNAIFMHISELMLMFSSWNLLLTRSEHACMWSFRSTKLFSTVSTRCRRYRWVERLSDWLKNILHISLHLRQHVRARGQRWPH